MTVANLEMSFTIRHLLLLQQWTALYCAGQLELMFREADADGDDVISEEEFMRFSTIHGDQIPHFRQVLLGLGPEETPSRKTDTTTETPELVLPESAAEPPSGNFAEGGGNRLTRRGKD